MNICKCDYPGKSKTNVNLEEISIQYILGIKYKNQQEAGKRHLPNKSMLIVILEKL